MCVCDRSLDETPVQALESSAQSELKNVIHLSVSLINCADYSILCSLRDSVGTGGVVRMP